MNIGFIGAGKVGFSLGKYFSEGARRTDGNYKVKGYWSLHGTSSQEAANFTNSIAYEEIKDLVDECDMIFLTVPDGSIKSVWEDISGYDLKGKKICHCSGAMSSEDAFLGIEERGAFGYSVHPLFAVSDKYNTYKELSGVFFTLEGCKANCRGGDDEGLWQLKSLLESTGNPARVIASENKTKYHCAAAVASNLVCGLIDMSIELFEECGFEEDEAVKALAPILMGNMSHIATDGPAKSLTGPIERNDVGTVAKHLDCIPKEGVETKGPDSRKEIYSLLSERLVRIAENRHPERDYSAMSDVLRKGE